MPIHLKVCRHDPARTSIRNGTPLKQGTYSFTAPVSELT